MTRLRNITANVIVAMLLLLSCVTARCEAVCSTMSSSISHGLVQSQQPGADEMAGMDDCGMSTQVKQPNASISAVTHASCEHHVCRQDLAGVQKEPVYKVSLRTLQAVAVIAAFTLQSASRDFGEFRRPDVPPLRSLSPLEASSVLRV